VNLRHPATIWVALVVTLALLATGCSSTTRTEATSSESDTPDVAATDSGGGEVTESVDPSAVETEVADPVDDGATAAAPAATGLPTLEDGQEDGGGQSAQERIDALMQGEGAIGKYPERVYVPNTLSDTVQVIDPETYKIIATYETDAIPHHITPSWDLTELYVLNTGGNTLLVIDPATGQPTETIPVIDPYNLYFTPDGENAIVVAERLRRLDIVDPDTWELKTQVSIPWPGVDHMAFARDGSWLVASTEFSGRVVKVDTENWVVMGEPLALGGEPIDVLRLPGTNTLLVANQGIGFGGVHVINGDTMEELDWIETGVGTHGLMLTHDRERIFVSNRGRQTGEGSITVLDTETLEILDTWVLPGGASPDMGQLNVEGDEFWIAGRYHHEVYVIDTADGSLRARIPTDLGPHGLTYFPSSTSPHSLGHNGVYMTE